MAITNSRHADYALGSDAQDRTPATVSKTKVSNDYFLGPIRPPFPTALFRMVPFPTHPRTTATKSRRIALAGTKKFRRRLTDTRQHFCPPIPAARSDETFGAGIAESSRFDDEPKKSILSNLAIHLRISHSCTDRKGHSRDTYEDVNRAVLVVGIATKNTDTTDSFFFPTSSGHPAMDRKAFVLAAIFQCTDREINDYKRWIGLDLLPENSVRRVKRSGMDRA
ncbi:hypothetical protein C8R45DRAFT_932042 [Mycena sanguinolenta]|nr:hypothetical protein C8R45DRAFT_932042 [Mycena sanguinolenta]